MLECYFDDSGTHDGSPIVCWGGLLGTTQQWDYLDKRWRALLAAPLAGETHPPKPPLRQFHLAHCAALDGDFRGYSRAESDRLRFLFREIIAESGVESYAFAVSTKDYDELVRGKVRKELGSAERLAAAGCLRKALLRANERGEDFVSIMLDAGAMNDELRELILTLERHYEGDTALVSIGSMAVAKLTMLQAADTIATESFWGAKDTICNDNRELSAHMKSMLGKVQTIRGYIMDREHLKNGLTMYRQRPWTMKRVRTA